MKKYDNPGFPEIIIHKDNFEIRRLYETEFVQFQFSDIKEIEYSEGKYKFWKLIVFGPFWSNPRTHLLKITLNNDEKWIYDTTEKFNQNFAQFIVQLIKLIGLK